MCIQTFLMIEFVVLLVIFAAVTLWDGFGMGKEEEARAAHRAELAKWYEQKAKEREEWNAQRWAAQQARTAALFAK